ncbi:hypothetical protein ACOSQ3_029435 [Xanthoceras sorbifolium]
MQYVQNYSYQQSNPYPSIYNPWLSNQQEKKSSVEDLISAFMSKQDTLMSKMDAHIHVQENSLKQLGQAVALEIKKLVEYPMGISQVEMELSKSLPHGDETVTSQEPLDSFVVHAIKENDSHKVANDALWLDSLLLSSYKSTFYFEELGEGKPKPPLPFKQPPHLGPKKLHSHIRYVWLGELYSLPVIWLE